MTRIVVNAIVRMTRKVVKGANAYAITKSVKRIPLQAWDQSDGAWKTGGGIEADDQFNRTW